jgi:hypothetical protein
MPIRFDLSDWSKNDFNDAMTRNDESRPKEAKFCRLVQEAGFVKMPIGHKKAAYPITKPIFFDSQIFSKPKTLLLPAVRLDGSTFNKSTKKNGFSCQVQIHRRP